SDWPLVCNVASTHTSEGEKTLSASKPNVPVSGSAGRESHPPLFRCSTYGWPWGVLEKMPLLMAQRSPLEATERRVTFTSSPLTLAEGTTRQQPTSGDD